jgi:hypothetical protein
MTEMTETNETTEMTDAPGLTPEPGLWAKLWNGLKNHFRRHATTEISEERAAALQARYAAEARRDDHMMTVRTHEPPMI